MSSDEINRQLLQITSPYNSEPKHSTTTTTVLSNTEFLEFDAVLVPHVMFEKEIH